MDGLTIITRAETSCVERNWRQGAGGRVLMFDMMLEMPQSQKVAVLGCQSEIDFEGRRYIVNHKEVVRKAPTETVRLMLTKNGGAAEPQRDRSGRPDGYPPHIRLPLEIPSAARLV
jgi:hypothetical protein